jgi:hypothetical protein
MKWRRIFIAFSLCVVSTPAGLGRENFSIVSLQEIGLSFFTQSVGDESAAAYLFLPASGQEKLGLKLNPTRPRADVGDRQGVKTVGESDVQKPSIRGVLGLPRTPIEFWDFWFNDEFRLVYSTLGARLSMTRRPHPLAHRWQLD